MLIAVEHTVHAISAVVQTVPVGTNIALMHILWVMMSGAFLQSRGAFFKRTRSRPTYPRESMLIAVSSGLLDHYLPESKANSKCTYLALNPFTASTGSAHLWFLRGIQSTLPKDQD
jgi:hypothetical protein